MQENTYIEPSTVINISASGDIITNTPNNRNSKDNNNNINASIHAGLSPSLWGSPATTTTTTTTFIHSFIYGMHCRWCAGPGARPG